MTFLEYMGLIKDAAVSTMKGMISKTVVSSQFQIGTIAIKEWHPFRILQRSI